MKYVGSKNRHSKEILQIILKNRKENQLYIEPFCGGCNIIDKVDNPRMANDSHFYLIEMWKALVNKNWEPPQSISEAEYKHIQYNFKLYPSELVGFVGFCCSYSGKWWGGYARGKNSKGLERNYCLESYKNIMKQVPRLKGVGFRHEDYLELNIPNDSLIYVDPPYFQTTKYKDFINYNEFWNWIRYISKHNDVYISEYNAPSDFICLWQKEVNNTLVKHTGSKKGIEKLFKYNG